MRTATERDSFEPSGDQGGRFDVLGGMVRQVESTPLLFGEIIRKMSALLLRSLDESLMRLPPPASVVKVTSTESPRLTTGQVRRRPS